MSNNLAGLTSKFLFDNIFAIFYVVVLFSVITIYIIIHDISFKQKKYKVNKVITIEKFTPKEFKLKAGEEMRNDNSCKKLKFKDTCVALGSCVWVTSNLKGKLVEKCTSANPNIDNTAPGSDGPEKKCFKHKGKLVPWENYYYLDGKSLKKKDIGIKFC